MAGASSSREMTRHLATLFQCGAVGQTGDGELLEQFVAGQGSAAQAAFAALVDRHAAMVLGVCRRVLGNWHEAEDAFQATFLVLARKAASIGRREQLACWLYGVARRTALDARARALRRQATEKRVSSMVPCEQPNPFETSDLRSVLDEELARLPERTRAALILCELEGLSRRQAAGRLGVSEGTLSSRLARGKAQLRDRLTRRGLALSATALASALSLEAQAVIVSPALVDSTIQGAMRIAAGSSLTGVVSTSVATLTQGALKAMLISKLKLIALGFASVTLVTAGVGVVAQSPLPATAQHADQDRLKSVEQKLDRLLEVLGGSSRATSPTATAPVPPIGALTPLSSDVASSAPEVSATSAGTSTASSADATHTSNGAGAAILSMMQSTAANSRISIDARVSSLEQRLTHLERRLTEMEHRLGQTDRRQPPKTSAAARSDVHVSPDRGPFEMDPAAANQELRSVDDRSPQSIAQPPDDRPDTSADLRPTDDVPAPPREPGSRE